MRVLVTGGTGSVGRAGTQRLVERGWEVRVIGRRAGIEIPGAEYASCDVMDYDGVRQQMRGCDAVVHLAAIAHPGRSPGPDVFGVNVLGTFNVFEAAAAEGARRIVQASSINAFGCFWSTVDLAVRYLPIDEEHPTFTTDPYSFSKGVVEEIGAYYWRRDGISSAALRLPWVMPQPVRQKESHLRRLRDSRALVAELAAQPAEQRRARIARVRRRVLEYRSHRPLEAPAAKDRPRPQRPAGDDSLFHIYAFERFNFWACVDERDSAQAIEKALTAEYDGSHVLFVNDDHNWLDCDAELLAELFFPDVRQRKKPLRGSASLVSIDRARALIGFEPEHCVATLVRPSAGEGGC